MTQLQQHKGGSIVSFIIVTVAIALLLVGGVAWLRHRSEVARQAEMTAQEDVAAPADTDEATSGQGSANGDQSRETQEEAANDSEPGGSTDENAESSAAQQGASEPASLPESGPTELAASVIAITATTYVVTRYLSSRRELSRFAP